MDIQRSDLISGNDLDTFIGYEKDINDIVDRMMADKNIGEEGKERRDAIISLLSILSTQMLARSAVLAMEVLEESHPEVTSRDLLAQSFTTMVADVVMRLRSAFHIYADKGFLPTAALAKVHIAEESVTKH